MLVDVNGGMQKSKPQEGWTKVGGGQQCRSMDSMPRRKGRNCEVEVKGPQITGMLLHCNTPRFLLEEQVRLSIAAHRGSVSESGRTFCHCC